MRGDENMKKILRAAPMVALLLGVAATLSACGSGVKFVRMDATEFPPKDDSAKIEIFEGDITAPHIVIGTLTAKKDMDPTYNDQSTYDQVMETLKQEARKVGADALINVRPLTAEGGGLKSRVQVTATAVRYLEKTETITSASIR
jgi:hypothetical protein